MAGRTALLLAYAARYRRKKGEVRLMGAAAAPHHTAERLLSDRFARGEIDETEFETRRAALRRN
ncbi:SHOCT domain-containing protein [Subtercola sp. RTI3]|uniref:SHOCT domain-containing protein n=1 Tax=Subtercola sp. RTI3 TaxID=3048639 RepID=UPI002B225709|nr:SHOCT domain-containing protein [Subtercola sp. RTI3]MEA9986770.1 SHOCT domain-containing protein [Subtercola sp. RTI3]